MEAHTVRPSPACRQLLPGSSAYCNCVIVGNVQLKALPIIPFRICKLWRWSENFNRNMQHQGKKKVLEEKRTQKRGKFVYKNGNEAVGKKRTRKKKRKMLCNFWSQISAFYSFYYNFSIFFSCSVAAQLCSLRLSYVAAVEQMKYEQDEKERNAQVLTSFFDFQLCCWCCCWCAEHDVDDDELKQWLGCCNNTMQAPK